MNDGNERQTSHLMEKSRSETPNSIGEEIKSQSSTTSSTSAVTEDDDDVNTAIQNKSHSIEKSCESVNFIYENDDFDVEVLSIPPSDFSESEHLLHMDFLQSAIDDIPIINKKLYKNGTRKSLTFTNDQMRDIERNNQILYEKIMKRGPSNNSTKNPFATNNFTGHRVSSAAINRRKQQRQIDLDNQVLKRKIDEIAGRRKKYYA